MKLTKEQVTSFVDAGNWFELNKAVASKLKMPWICFHAGQWHFSDDDTRMDDNDNSDHIERRLLPDFCNDYAASMPLLDEAKISCSYSPHYETWKAELWVKRSEKEDSCTNIFCHKTNPLVARIGVFLMMNDHD